MKDNQTSGHGAMESCLVCFKGMASGRKTLEESEGNQETPRKRLIVLSEELLSRAFSDLVEPIRQPWADLPLPGNSAQSGRIGFRQRYDRPTGLILPSLEGRQENRVQLGSDRNPGVREGAGRPHREQSLPEIRRECEWGGSHPAQANWHRA